MISYILKMIVIFNIVGLSELIRRQSGLKGLYTASTTFSREFGASVLCTNCRFYTGMVDLLMLLRSGAASHVVVRLAVLVGVILSSKP